METLPTELRLEIVTPERRVVQESVSAVSLPGKNGYLGILPGHAPLITELKTGALTFSRGANAQAVAVSGGFAEVLPDRVTVLAHTAELAEGIDRQRAEQAKQRAEDELKRAADSAVNAERARAALERASTRLEIASRVRS